jgi:hypothetical protein
MNIYQTVEDVVDDIEIIHPRGDVVAGADGGGGEGLFVCEEGGVGEEGGEGGGGEID